MLVKQMLLIGGIVLVSSRTTIGEEDANSLQLDTSSELRVEGTSNVHAYTILAEHLSIQTKTEPVDIERLSEPEAAFYQRFHHGRLQQLALTIPVAEMSSSRAGLDRRFYQALKSKDYPEIRFLLTDYQITGEGVSRDAFVIDCSGELTVAGKTQPISLKIGAEFSDKGLVITGNKELLMSQFDIRPPTAMMGLMKTGDRVTIRFALILK